jgi:hypothetical protein
MQSREIKDLIEKLYQEDWDIERTRNGHYKFKSPTGKVVYGPQTPSDMRSYRNIRAELRRAGAHV